MTPVAERQERQVGLLESHERPIQGRTLVNLSSDTSTTIRKAARWALTTIADHRLRSILPMGIILRAWTRFDAPALVRAVQLSPDLASQFGEESPANLRTAQSMIDSWVERTTAYGFAVEMDSQVLGNVGISSIEHRHNTAWVHYWVSAEGRGKGLAARGLATLTEWAFSELGLFRLELGHRINNPASCRTALLAGFEAEGIERKKLRYGEDRFDVETHARLRTDPTPAVAPVELIAPNE